MYSSKYYSFAPFFKFLTKFVSSRSICRHATYCDQIAFLIKINVACLFLNNLNFMLGWS